MRALVDEESYGEQSFEFYYAFYDIELFFTLFEEFMQPMILSFVAVIAVILIITSDITATMVVALCVLMTDIFVAGVVYYWNLTLNPIVLL